MNASVVFVCRILGLLLLLCGLPAVATAQPCPARVIFSNGIDTFEDDARDARDKLRETVNARLKASDRSELPAYCFDYAYASTRDEKLDLLEAWAQRFVDNITFGGFWRWLGRTANAVDLLPWQVLADIYLAFGNVTYLLNPDLQSQVGSYRAWLLNSQRVIVVAHSQGNLFANEAFGVLTSGADGLAPLNTEQFHIVSVATPAHFVAGQPAGSHTTLYGDVILAVSGRLPANTEVAGTPCGATPPHLQVPHPTTGVACHSFLDSYLTGTLSGPQVLNRIVAAIPLPQSPLPTCAAINLQVSIREIPPLDPRNFAVRFDVTWNGEGEVAVDLGNGRTGVLRQEFPWTPAEYPRGETDQIVTATFVYAGESTSTCKVDMAVLVPEQDGGDVDVPEVLGFVQVTHSTAGDNWRPSITDDGKRVAFLGRQFSHDSGNYDLFLWTEGLGTVQLTTGGRIESATISGNGSRVFFTSTSDLTPGAPGNPEGQLELFVWSAGGVVELSKRAPPDFGTATISPPSVSSDGHRVAFASSHDFSTGAFAPRLYIWTEGTGIQSLGVSAGSTAINGAGSRIAFVSSEDITPGAPGNSSGLQLFLWTEGEGFTQLTNATSWNMNEEDSVAMDRDGKRIVFTSNGDLTPGAPGNADGNPEVFLWSDGGGIGQLTDTMSSGQGLVFGGFAPRISRDGGVVAFTSNADLLQTGAATTGGVFSVFIWTSNGGITRVTTGASSVSWSASEDGSRIALASNGDLSPGLPGNADANREVFLAILGSTQ